MGNYGRYAGGNDPQPSTDAGGLLGKKVRAALQGRLEARRPVYMCVYDTRFTKFT
jgi:hypothetical protein